MEKASVAPASNRRDRSITRRLIVLIVLFSSVITLVITALQLLDEFTRGVDDVKSQIEQIETLSLPSLTENLWNLYNRQIQSQLDDLVRAPDVVYLEIRSAGRLVAVAGERQDHEDLIDDSVLMIYQRGNELIEIGELKVQATLEGVYRQIYDRIFIILVSNALKTALVAVFMFFLFRHLVTRHLDRISEYLQNFSLEDAAEPLTLKRKPAGDEIDLVVDKINQLMDNLGETTVSRDRLEELVDERTNELHETQEELLRKGRLAMLGQVAATVSHELRNPLAVIRSSLYTIKKRLGNDDRAKAAYERIDRNVDQCDRIIDELLDFTRITRLEKKPIVIDAWLAQIFNDIEIPGDIEVELRLELGDIEIGIDPDRLRRAVINIVDNGWQSIEANEALHRNGERGRIVVSTRIADGRLYIIVSDNGGGMSQEECDKVFVALYSTKGFGVGLGMPTVKQIMEQHEGGVEIDSEPGRGARVKLWVPFQEDAAAVRATA